MKTKRAPQPGWRMSNRQQAGYWRRWREACESQHWSPGNREQRMAVHATVFDSEVSAKDINPKGGVDKIFREFERLAGSIGRKGETGSDAEAGQRVRLLHAIGERIPVLMDLTSESYVATLLKDRFKVIPGVRDIGNLKTDGLVQLITTVNSRITTLQPGAEVV